MCGKILWQAVWDAVRDKVWSRVVCDTRDAGRGEALRLLRQVDPIDATASVELHVVLNLDFACTTSAAHTS